MQSLITSLLSGDIEVLIGLVAFALLLYIGVWKAVLAGMWTRCIQRHHDNQERDARASWIKIDSSNRPGRVRVENHGSDSLVNARAYLVLSDLDGDKLDLYNALQFIPTRGFLTDGILHSTGFSGSGYGQTKVGWVNRRLEADNQTVEQITIPHGEGVDLLIAGSVHIGNPRGHPPGYFLQIASVDGVYYYGDALPTVYVYPDGGEIALPGEIRILSENASDIHFDISISYDGADGSVLVCLPAQ